MVANLPPQYHEAEERYRKATLPQDKLTALQDMLRLLPKHKASEKMQADLKKKISDYKKQVTQKSKKKSGPDYSVDSHGHPQIVFIGAPNGGRSQLISTLTGVSLKVENYPFSTRIPQPAMMDFENVRLQLVDIPPVAPVAEAWLYDNIRTADAIVWVVDLAAAEVLEDIESVKELLASNKIFLHFCNQDVPKVEKGIVKKALLVGNKNDLSEAKDNLELVQELLEEEFAPFLVSGQTGEALEELKKKIFLSLDLIRVYSKAPGKKPDLDSPFLLSQKSTFIDLAASIHKDFAKEVKSAKIWNSNKHPDGKNIPRDFELEDGNIVEMQK